MEKEQRLQLLKDVFTLIHPELVGKTSAQRERDNEERKVRVQTWLSNVVQATSQEENPWKVQDRCRGGLLNLLPQFMHLLRECLLTHQWTQMLSMLKCLTHIPYGADWVTWKATLTALYTEPESNISFIQDFFKHCYLLKECNVYDVALEFVQFLISQDLTQEASHVMQTARRARSGAKSEYQRDLTQHAITLLDGYQGLVFYMDWKAAINKQLELSQNTLSESFYNLTSSQGPSDDVVRNIAKRATVGLDALVQKAGVWDIFLTKSIEIHEFYGEFDMAKDLLNAYRDRNPDNPNAHRFMYEFLTRNSAHHNGMFVSEESLSCLKCLAKLDPANPLVLALWQKLTDSESPEQALRFVFDLLDYDIWREKAEGWRCLAMSLGTGLSKMRSQEERSVFITVLSSCWSSRKDWWPVYHFRSCAGMNPDQLSCHELLVSKAIAAAVLTGQDCHFTKETRTMLNNNSSCHQHLDKILSDLDWNMITDFTEQHRDSCIARSPRTPRRQSKKLSAVPGQCLMKNNTTATTVSSSSFIRIRPRRSTRSSNSFAKTEIQNPDCLEMRNSNPVTRSRNNTDPLQNHGLTSGGDFVAADEGSLSDNTSSVDLSSSSSASVDYSSSDLSSAESETGHKQNASDPSRVYKLPKTKRCPTDTERLKYKRVNKSDVSNEQRQEMLDIRVTERRKRKRRVEDVDNTDSRPLKQRRTEM